MQDLRLNDESVQLEAYALEECLVIEMNNWNSVQIILTEEKAKQLAHYILEVYS